ncbi:MAG: aldo/keto reductase [Gammaproteobacteria bacterium]|jgi:aryl-alcohol dehydrogenase-like predicted oxidoreductase|nr:aldo/keto reductase [Chromatiales bacterium]MDP7153359.1 aldo/keto reductase [Gammaproteobacteria bacterium]MDP7419279.1 aldo/keto reductase [Gammaproteobacteria bacterium]MDP7659720.1 aldo/keto reductase [Gammaproteobacteria bacterium]
MNRRQLIKQAAGAALSLNWNPLQAKIQNVMHKTIPGTSEILPVIGLGTNRYSVGNAQHQARLRQALQTFHEHGGTLIDTAPMYRGSEIILGQLIKTLNIREQLFIATKADRAADNNGPERLANSFAQLQTDRLDLVQSHNLRGVDSMLPVLREQQLAGRVRYVGITTSRENQFAEFLDVMNKYPLDFIQVNYSLIDRKAAEHILPLAADKGIAVLANLPLSRGALFKKVGDRPLPDWAAEFNCTSWAQFFLKYVISHPAVNCAIPGMTRTRHVIDNLGAALGRLPDATQRRRQEQYIDGL